MTKHNKNLERIEKRLREIEKESIAGKGYRWDRKQRADEWALNLYLDGDIDWLVEQANTLRKIADRWINAEENGDEVDINEFYSIVQDYLIENGNF